MLCTYETVWVGKVGTVPSSERYVYVIYRSHPHSNKVLGSILGQGVSEWSLNVLLVPAWVLYGASSFLPQSNNMKHVDCGFG